MASSTAEHRLHAVTCHLSPHPNLVVVLPDGAKVTKIDSRRSSGEISELFLDGQKIVEYHLSMDRSYSMELSSLGTRFEGITTHVPKYKLLHLNRPLTSTTSVQDTWAAIYALWTIYHEQEYIPISISTLPEANKIAEYLISTGLGRLSPNKPCHLPRDPDVDEVYFLNRAAFWQGAGITGYHDRSWIPIPRPVFPSVSSFTRTENVVAKHPLRPSKPKPGEVLYRRWCSAVGQMLELTYFDVNGVSDPLVTEGTGGLSRHMAAFHKWHNDERVNSAWGEKGSLEMHMDYVCKVLGDPHTLPCMFSWDGELMGYVEVNYTKEDHAAPYFPSDSPVGDWDRGIHVLVGESKFLGGRSEIWIRSLIHYIFLADPRSNRVLGEPDSRNKAILRVAENAGFYSPIVFDFPYKRSVMVLHTRDKFFTMCRLR